MRKRLFFLTLLAALFLPLRLSAQVELTVADGTETNEYVPVYGYYTDAYQINQMIFPAEMLEEMVGGTINGLTWYMSAVAEDAWGSNVEIYMAEVTAATCSGSLITSPDLTMVWSGLMNGTTTPIAIEFDDSYTYLGGNLLIEVHVTNEGEYSHGYFYGISQNGGAQYGYSYDGISDVDYFNPQNFLPKVTFEYIPTSGDLCYKPRGLHLTDISENSVTVGWVDTLNSAATYEIRTIAGFDTNVVITNLNDTTYTISGLNANTAYSVQVRALCSADNGSGWASALCRTNCAPVSELPFRDGFESYVTGSGNFPVCWIKVRGTATYPYVSTNSSIDGQNLFWSMSNTTDTVLFCTDALPISADAMHISYWQGSNIATEVGYMTDTADASSFVSLKSVNTESYWRQIDLYTDTIEGITSTSEVYLAFRTVGSGFCYLDGILVEEIGDCRRPIDADLYERTHNSITINWTPDPAASVTTYDVLMSRNNAVNVSDSTAVLYTGITDTFLVATDLTPNTTYYFWVRTACGTDGSDWTRIGGIGTYRSCYPVSNLTVENVSLTSAYVTWEYAGNGRGLEESGVHLILRDTANTIVREWDMTAAEGSSTFIAGLGAATPYTLELRTFCDPDTADGTTISFSTSSCGEDAAGGSTSSYSPLYGTYNYGYTQTLYPISDISSMTSITGLSWYVSSVPSSYPTRPIEVWIGTTSMSAEALTTTNIVDTTQMTRVVNLANLDVSTVGWTSVTFDQPWTPTANGDKIVVAVVNHTGGWSSISWRGHTGIKCVYGYQDPVPSDFYSISSYNSNSTTTTVADIRFIGECATECVPPLLAVTNVDMNSVDLRWARGLDENAWAVQYKIDTVATWTDAEGTTDTLATVTDLSAMTHYTFRVGSLCEGGDTMWSNAVSAWTLCEPLETLPLIQDFEGIPSGVDPLCWSFTNLSSNSSSNHYVTTSTKHAGQQSMYFYPYGGYQYLISPAMPAGTNPADLEIMFWGNIPTGNSSRIEMGFMTDPTNVNTFRLMYQALGNGSTWTEYTAYTDTTTLTTDDEFYVVFRAYSSSSNSIYLDDIAIGTANCRRPRQLHATNVIDTAAHIAWTGMEGASYEYYYSIDDTIAAAAEFLTSENTSVDLSGLTPSTTYNFWARTICEDDSTSWSSPLSFRTACGTVHAPWNENFDNWSSIDQCWATYQGLMTDSVSTPTSYSGGWYTSTYAMGGSKNIKVNIYGTSCKYWVATPAIAVEDNTVLTFDVALTAYSSSNAPGTNVADDRFVVAVTTDSVHFTPLYQFGSDPNRDDELYTSLNQNARNILIPLGDYSGSNIRIAFYGESTVSGSDNDLHIDNVAIVNADCMRPAFVHVNAAAESAVITWRDYSSENTSGYEFILSPTNSMTDSNATVYTLNEGDTSITLTGLTPQTTYYYFLRSTCEETPTAASWVRNNFRTPCLVTDLPFNEGFEGIPSGSGTNPDCWSFFENSTSSSSNHYVSTTSPHSGTQCMYFYPYGTQYLVSPVMPAGTNPAQLEVTFWAKISSSGSSRIDAGLMSDPSDPTTFQQFFTHNSNSSTWTEYAFYTDTATLTDDEPFYVAFRVYCSNGYSNYLDDISIANAGCRRPTSVSVVDNTVTPSSAQLEWPEVTGVTNYRVKYGTTDTLSQADSIDVTTNGVSLDNLQHGTTYHVWVYSLCDDGTISDPRHMTFATELACYPITGLTRTGESGSAIAYMWNHDERGYEATGAVIVLHDNADSAGVNDTLVSDGLNYHIFTNLDHSHTYRATFYNQCDTFAAPGVSVDIVFDPCASITGNVSISRIPFYAFYKYGYTQALYPRSTVSNMTEINGAKWYVNTPISATCIIDVYIGVTDSTTLDYNSPIPVTAMTKVASNKTINVSQSGWTGVTFDSTWTVPDSGANLVVAVVNKTGSYTSGLTWRGHSGRGISGYQDGTMADYTNMSAYSNKYNDTIVADISFMGNCTYDEEACVAPAIVVTDIDSVSATVIWVGSSESYQVQYRGAGEEWTDAENNVSPAVIDGLQPGSTYSVRVGSLCADGDTLFSNTLSFITDCAPVHMPYSITPADLAYGISPCIDYQNFYRSSSSGNYYVYTSSSNGRFVLPEIIEPLNTAQLRFKVAATSSTPTSMRVGIMENDGSITWVDTLALPHLSNSSLVTTEMVSYLDNYTGSGNRVVVGSMGNNYMYFHELHVEPLDNCRMVSGMTMSNVADDTATLSWTAGAGQTQWLVYLNDSLVATSTTPTYTFTSLTGTTNYIAGVRTLCGAGDTARMSTVGFRTTDHAYSLPYVSGFEASDDNVWYTEGSEGGNGWYIGSATNHGGSRALYISDNNGTANHYNTGSSSEAYFYRLFSVIADDYAISFDWRAHGENSYDFLRVFLVPGSVNITSASISDSGTPTGWIALDGGEELSLDSSWTTIQDTVTLTAGNYYLLFYWQNDVSVGTQPPAAIDNVSFAVVGTTPGPTECFAPTALSVSNVDTNRATLQWVAGGEETQWQIRVNDSQDYILANATTYTLNNLTRGTQYRVRVRAYCSETTQSGWSAELSFTTPNNSGIETVAEGLFSLYPNPAANIAVVESTTESMVNIIDQSGRTVYSSTDASTMHRIDVGSLGKGAYYVRVTTQDGTAVRKLIVQ